MRDITALIRIHEVFSDDGCRISDFKQLKQVYTPANLIRELERVFAFARESQDYREIIILRWLAYIYLYAFLYFELNFLGEIYETAATYNRDYEKAIAPRWWDFLLGAGSPSENSTRVYESNRKSIPVMDQMRPTIEFMFSRCGDYDVFAKPIREHMHHLDRLYSNLGSGIPPIVFELLDYLDEQVRAKPRSPWQA